MNETLTTSWLLFWNKYRPVVLKLMVEAKETPQSYGFFAHELRSITPKGASPIFTVQLHNGKPLQRLKESVITHGLIQMLSSSRKAMELMQTDTYEFSLNREHKLNVTLVKTL